LATGSMLTRIIVSDRDGSFVRRSTPSNSIVSRRVPSHFGISPGVAVGVGVRVRVGTMVGVTATGDAALVWVDGPLVVVGSIVAVGPVVPVGSPATAAMTMTGVPAALRTAIGTDCRGGGSTKTSW